MLNSRQIQKTARPPYFCPSKVNSPLLFDSFHDPWFLRFMGIKVLTHNPIDDILSSVRIITTKRLGQYCRKHALARPSLSRWVRITKKARWTTWEDVKSSFSSADLVRVAGGRNCVVFDIAGNEYRLIAAVHHARGEGKGRVYILNFLTHAEYDTNQWKEHL